MDTPNIEFEMSNFSTAEKRIATSKTAVEKKIYCHEKCEGNE